MQLNSILNEGDKVVNNLLFYVTFGLNFLMFTFFILLMLKLHNLENTKQKGMSTVKFYNIIV